jgi:hypothetical protein
VSLARAEPPARAPAATLEARRQQAQEEFQIRLGAARSVAPLPPRRPGDLTPPVQVAALAPLPPTRPGDLARANRAAELPSVITSGTKAPVAAAANEGLGLLAFAPSSPSLADPPKPPVRQAVVAKTSAAPVIAQPLGLRSGFGPPRRVVNTASRLDRSNFRVLTGSEEIARLTPAALGPVAAPLRAAAARSGLSDVMFAEPADVATRFQASAASLTVSAFSGPAVGALPRLETASAAGFGGVH